MPPLIAPRTYTSSWLLSRLAAAGYDTFTGVPCSLFGDLFAQAEQHPDFLTIPATREDLCLGVAAGVALGGGRPVVAMQNSGLGMILNATQSLQEMYGLHVLLLISWRGEGPDAPEHEGMGRRMPQLLAAADIPWAFAAQVDDVPAETLTRPGPAALVVRAGELSSHA